MAEYGAARAPGEVKTAILCGRVVNIVAEQKPHIRAYKTELREILAAMKKGDSLPNTVASLEAKVGRRALLVAVHYEDDMRNTEDDSLLIPTSPVDVWRVYRMLLSRGYEPQNIRILVEGVVRDYLTHGTKQNITDSLEWLFHSAESGDHRYFHFSGHGYAYEAEEGEGKVARARLALPNGVGHEHPNPVTCDEQLSLSPGNQVKFYREALLTKWETPTEMEIVESEEPIMLDAYNRINEEEFKTMVSKLPKGCMLTITLDCFHGGQMYNVNRERPVTGYRGGAGWPINEPEANQSTTKPFNTHPNSSPRNLFVPPAFHLYSDFSFDPNVRMERVQGPDPLDGVQATVFVWSAYSTSLAQAGVFTSAFTSVIQGLTSDLSHHEMFQAISREIGENIECKGGHPLIQFQTPRSCEDEVEALMRTLVI